MDQLKNLIHPGELIAWFDDLGSGNEEYNFLSNFYEGEPITLPGVTWDALMDQFPDVNGYVSELRDILDHDEYSLPSGPVEFPTGEHAFAAMKAWGTDQLAFARMVIAQSPNEVKALGRTCQLREDWELVKLDVMVALIRAKFTLDREEGKRLLDTGDALLIEGTFWGDDVWGVALYGDPDAEQAYGRNWLGTLLMARRAELRAEKAFGRTSLAAEANARFARKPFKPAWMK